MLAPQSILAWIVIGAVAGWLAGLLVKGYGLVSLAISSSAFSVQALRACLRRALGCKRARLVATSSRPC